MSFVLPTSNACLVVPRETRNYRQALTVAELSGTRVAVPTLSGAVAILLAFGVAVVEVATHL